MFCSITILLNWQRWIKLVSSIYRILTVICSALIYIWSNKNERCARGITMRIWYTACISHVWLLTSIPWITFPTVNLPMTRYLKKIKGTHPVQILEQDPMGEMYKSQILLGGFVEGAQEPSCWVESLYHNYREGIITAADSCLYITSSICGRERISISHGCWFFTRIAAKILPPSQGMSHLVRVNTNCSVTGKYTMCFQYNRMAAWEKNYISILLWVHIWQWSSVQAQAIYTLPLMHIITSDWHVTTMLFNKFTNYLFLG